MINMNTIEYPWEVITKFEWHFLPRIFPNNFQRKFSKEGAFNLITLNNAYYEIQISKTTSMLSNNGVLTTDCGKNEIIDNICQGFKEKANLAVNNGIIYFKALDWFFKIKVVKKLKSFNPNNLRCM